ncbi:MAG: hypothetical protein XU13_C0032G0024 [Candidatus Rokubacteria bacterium CSP1-6]|nr:MAG: hypothetical protein XU13_C0032G0024 [Candidatus Rokubacteria bacterium CSP1-6]
MASDLGVFARRFAWGFGIAGFLIPVLIEGAWRLDWMDWIIPDFLLDWVIVVWPWSALLVYAEDAGVPLALLILAISIFLNVLFYTAVGALVGALVSLNRRR